MTMIPFHKDQKLTPADALIKCEVCNKSKFVWSWELDEWIDEVGDECKTSTTQIGDEHSVTLCFCKCGHAVSIIYDSPDGSFVYIADRYSY